MGLLKFLFITICVLWLLKMIARLLLPVLFQKMVSKVQNQANQKYQQQNQNNSTDGIRVDYIPPRHKNQKNDKTGDFIDYEEVKHS
ncbi:MAG: DUF4834 family protein [Daejeonella sp.]